MQHGGISDLSSLDEMKWYQAFGEGWDSQEVRVQGNSSNIAKRYYKVSHSSGQTVYYEIGRLDGGNEPNVRPAFKIAKVIRTFFWGLAHIPTFIRRGYSRSRLATGDEISAIRARIDDVRNASFPGQSSASSTKRSSQSSSDTSSSTSHLDSSDTFQQEEETGPQISKSLTNLKPLKSPEGVARSRSLSSLQGTPAVPFSLPSAKEASEFASIDSSSTTSVGEMQEPQHDVQRMPDVEELAASLTTDTPLVVQHSGVPHTLPIGSGASEFDAILTPLLTRSTDDAGSPAATLQQGKQAIELALVTCSPDMGEALALQVRGIVEDLLQKELPQGASFTLTSATGEATRNNILRLKLKGYVSLMDEPNPKIGFPIPVKVFHVTREIDINVPAGTFETTFDAERLEGTSPPLIITEATRESSERLYSVLPLLLPSEKVRFAMDLAEHFPQPSAPPSDEEAGAFEPSVSMDHEPYMFAPSAPPLMDDESAAIELPEQPQPMNAAVERFVAAERKVIVTMEKRTVQAIAFAPPSWPPTAPWPATTEVFDSVRINDEAMAAQDLVPYIESLNFRPEMTSFLMNKLTATIDREFSRNLVAQATQITGVQCELASQKDPTRRISIDFDGEEVSIVISYHVGLTIEGQTVQIPVFRSVIYHYKQDNYSRDTTPSPLPLDLPAGVEKKETSSKQQHTDSSSSSNEEDAKSPADSLVTYPVLSREIGAETDRGELRSSREAEVGLPKNFPILDELERRSRAAQEVREGLRKRIEGLQTELKIRETLAIKEREVPALRVESDRLADQVRKSKQKADDAWGKLTWKESLVYKAPLLSMTTTVDQPRLTEARFTWQEFERYNAALEDTKKALEIATSTLDDALRQVITYKPNTIPDLIQEIASIQTEMDQSNQNVMNIERNIALRRQAPELAVRLTTLAQSVSAQEIAFSEAQTTSEKRYSTLSGTEKALQYLPLAPNLTSLFGVAPGAREQLELQAQATRQQTNLTQAKIDQKNIYSELLRSIHEMAGLEHVSWPVPAMLYRMLSVYNLSKELIGASGEAAKAIADTKRKNTSETIQLINRVRGLAKRLDDDITQVVGYQSRLDNIQSKEKVLHLLRECDRTNLLSNDLADAPRNLQDITNRAQIIRQRLESACITLLSEECHNFQTPDQAMPGDDGTFTVHAQAYLQSLR